jgi:uncharacterized membrane protein
MNALDVIAILSMGLMTGVELSVAAFMNPALRRLDAAPQGKALGLLAISLGRVMPVWYSVSLLLMIASGYTHRHYESVTLIYAAAGILVLCVVASIALLVPINKRIAQLATGGDVPDWQRQHAKWDTLHRARLIALIVAFACLVAALIV